jgi:hypothetical protein
MRGWTIKNIIELLFKTLPVEQKHTGCTRCNYQGCIWMREKYPVYGHWFWVADIIWNKIHNFFNLKRQYRRLKRYLTQLDYSKIDNVEVDGIDTRDYPDFCDAYISYAEYKGKEMTEAQLDRLNEDRDYVYECVQDRLY